MIVGLHVRPPAPGPAMGAVIVDHGSYQATNLGVMAIIDLGSRGASAAWNGLRSFIRKPGPVVVIPQALPPAFLPKDKHEAKPVEPIIADETSWLSAADLKLALDAFAYLSILVIRSAVTALKRVSALWLACNRLLRSWTPVLYGQFGGRVRTALSPDQAIMVRQHSATLAG